MPAWKNDWKVHNAMDGDAACLDNIHMKKGRKDGDKELTRIMLQESFHSLLNLLKEVYVVCIEI